MKLSEPAARDRKEMALKGSRFHDGVPAEGGSDAQGRAAREEAAARNLFRLARSLRREDKFKEARDIYIMLSKSTNLRFAAAAHQGATWLSVVLIQKDNEHAPFEWLVTSHQDDLTVLFRCILDGESMGEIDDLMQRAFLKAWRSLWQLRNPRRFTPWLRRIARNLGYDHLRQRQHRAEKLQTFQEESRYREEGGGPSDSLRDLLKIISDPTDREILYLRFEKGLTYSEIAREMKIDVGADAIRKRVDRIERILRKRLN